MLTPIGNPTSNTSTPISTPTQSRRGHPTSNTSTPISTPTQSRRGHPTSNTSTPISTPTQSRRGHPTLDTSNKSVDCNSRQVKTIKKPKNQLPASKRDQHPSSKFSNYTISSPVVNTTNKVNLQDAIPLDEATKQKFDIAILLLFSNFSFFQPNSQEFNLPYKECIKKIPKLQFFCDPTNKILKECVIKSLLEKDAYNALARVNVLLRECRYLLESMPDSYKAYLLKDFPEEEKTHANLEKSFNNQLKMTYESLISIVGESQQFYNLPVKNKSIRKQVSEQINNLKAKTSNLSKKKSDKINKYINQTTLILTQTTTDENIIDEYNKIRKKIKNITKNTICLDRIAEIYDIKHASEWGKLELEVKQTQDKLWNLTNKSSEIRDLIDKSISDSTSIEAKIFVKERIRIYKEYNDKTEELLNLLQQQTSTAENIIKEAKDKIPDQLYNEMIEGSMISKKVIDKMTSSLVNIITKTRKKITEAEEEYRKILLPV